MNVNINVLYKTPARAEFDDKAIKSFDTYTNATEFIRFMKSDG